jgi:DNA-binding NarL/FixJ family response regulator
VPPSPRRPPRPPSSGPGEDLAAAEADLLAGEWVRARDGFRGLVDAEGAVALEGLAQAAWWLDDARTCLTAREEAHRHHLADGDVLGAARTAATLGYDAALFGQGVAVAQGWLGRARDLLDDVDGPTVEHGWLAVREAELALQVTHRLEVAEEAAARAVDVGRVTGRRDLELVGLGLLGLADVLAGRLERGMERLDTAAAGAVAGDISDLMWVGKTLCWLVVACRGAQDLPRALEWCARIDAMCRDRDLAPLFTACRVQYASVRLASGHWVDAEHRLVDALERMQGSRRATRTDAVVQLGHLRRRQGRLEEAEELYAQAGFAPQAVVGRALVRLDRGDAEAAWALASGVLEDVSPEDRLTRATVLLPAVRCAVAAGATTEAGALADELGEVADDVGTDGVRGAAAVARALVADPHEARRLWRTAVRCFHRAGLPVEEADARVASALALAGDRPALARDELRAAVAVLEALDVPERLVAAQALLADLGPGPEASGSPPPLTPREAEVLRLVADGLSTAGIARQLVLSEHTVHRHVANILTRLDQPTRAAAVAQAVREGML